MEIHDYAAEITHKAMETQEEFIFQTILPYCESITEMRISKEYLRKALLTYKRLEAEKSGQRAVAALEE